MQSVGRDQVQFADAQGRIGQLDEDADDVHEDHVMVHDDHDDHDDHTKDLSILMCQ